MAQHWVKQGWITTYSQGTWDAGKAMLHGQRALRLWLEFVAYLELFFYRLYQLHTHYSCCRMVKAEGDEWTM
jgi:hypothetical protein